MMIETPSTSTESPWNPIKLDRFLAQVQALVELHNLQEKELTETKSALLDAQLELKQTQSSLQLQAIQQPEQAETESTFEAKRNAHRGPEEENLVREAFSQAEQKWNDLADISGSNKLYSSQPPQSQNLKAFTPETVQKLLEEINSCIALLED
jgi:hypothetical protein